MSRDKDAREQHVRPLSLAGAAKGYCGAGDTGDRGCALHVSFTKIVVILYVNKHLMGLC